MSSDIVVKKTPFYKYHFDAKAKIVEFAGYLMPIQYESMTNEHKAVRENIGLFDLSHMGEFEVSGADALSFLQKITTNNVAALEVGQIQYSCMTYEDGGIVDDLLLYRLESSYLLIVNASNLKKDYDWISSHISGDVSLVDRSDQLGLLAIQGPNAQKLLKELTDYSLEEMKYYTSATAKIAGESVLFSRTGYTGEDGFELYIHNDKCAKLWESIVEVGKKYNLQLIGLGARDSLRLEMKMALYGNDIDQTTSPIEASLGWIVDFNKDFIGKDILLNQKSEKPKRRLICLEFEEKLFPRQGYEIYDNDEQIGKVTSGTFSQSLQKPIAMAYLPLKKCKIGTQVEVSIRNKRYIASVVKPPFYKKASHR